MKFPVQLTDKCVCKLPYYYFAGISHRKHVNITRHKVLSNLYRRGLTTLSENARFWKPPWRVLFFGTDDFSIPSLSMLYKELEKDKLIRRLAVVTSLKAKKNPVRDFAIANELTVFRWPYHPIPGEYDIGLVASFGHLIPERVIESFPLGMLNVHASLLPRWRGAAPIIYAILNGDTETGITIMQVEPRRFDIGKIVSQETCPISPVDTAVTVRARLADMGSQLLHSALQDLPHCLYKSVPQPESGITYAPRVTSALSLVDWKNMDAETVYNLYRALAGLYSLRTSWHGMMVKLFEPSLELEVCDREQRTSNSWLLNTAGCVELDPTGNYLRVLCANKQWIGFRAIGVPGKKRMSPQDFYNGYISKHSAVEWIFT
ncbi:methionyl-tRNA formyltransferase, mitochondrial [Periplaneta americana]|uniref:methionyl-tRNA formyltransferase, mitochondrial n=1 Tax=Periplaneta americana TaxID=6978 RepID=UPI0037E9B634